MNNKDLFNLVVNELQEKARVNNLKTAHEMYKQLKIEIIQNSLNRIEREIVQAMLEGSASTNIKLNRIEKSHGEEIANYFREKRFHVNFDTIYMEEGPEYFICIEWASIDLNL